MTIAPSPRKMKPKRQIAPPPPDTLDLLCAMYAAMVTGRAWYHAEDYIRLVLKWQKEQKSK